MFGFSGAIESRWEAQAREEAKGPPPERPPRMRLGWEAEMRSANAGLTSHKAPWVFEDQAQARRWVEYFFLAHISMEIPAAQLTGAISSGYITRDGEKETIRPADISRSIEYTENGGVLRWADDGA